MGTILVPLGEDLPAGRIQLRGDALRRMIDLNPILKCREESKRSRPSPPPQWMMPGKANRRVDLREVMHVLGVLDRIALQVEAGIADKIVFVLFGQSHVETGLV